jgi:diguanylate cyclase (GGDEF)-like protein
MREGEPVGEPKKLEVKTEDFAGKVSLISRLANYINAAFCELEYAALRDGMTGLFNRSEIHRRIADRLESGKTLSLVMLDIDNFKSVNDTYGHKEGDNVIIGLANLLRQGNALHGGKASIGRWGGEEFMILLPYGLEHAKTAAAELGRKFSEICFEKAGHNTISLGVTEAIPGESVDKLLVRVDTALYEAKRTGKNKFVVK